jgi:hypothetical protein
MIKKIPKVNEVVVFRKRSEPAFGIMKESIGERALVFSEEGKDAEVDFGKIVLSTGIKFTNELTQSERKLKLRELRRGLEEKRSTVDLKTLWECVFDADRELTLEELVELYFGGSNSGDEDVLLLFWAVEKDDLYFKRRDISPECQKRLRK